MDVSTEKSPPPSNGTPPGDPTIDDLLAVVEELVESNKMLSRVIFEQQRFMAGMANAMKYFPALKAAFDSGLQDADQAADDYKKKMAREKAVADLGGSEDDRFMSIPGAKVFG